jgi:hypothetical protein
MTSLMLLELKQVVKQRHVEQVSELVLYETCPMN